MGQSGHAAASWRFYESPPGTLPTGVAVIEGADSASIAGSIVMVNVKPNGYVSHVVMDLPIEGRGHSTISACKLSPVNNA